MSALTVAIGVEQTKTERLSNDADDPHLPLAARHGEAQDRVLALLANRLGDLREARVPFPG